MNINIRKLLSKLRNNQTHTEEVVWLYVRNERGIQNKMSLKGLRERLKNKDNNLGMYLEFWRPGMESWTDDLETAILGGGQNRNETFLVCMAGLGDETISDIMRLNRNARIIPQWSYLTLPNIITLLQEGLRGDFIYLSEKNEWVLFHEHPVIQKKIEEKEFEILSYQEFNTIKRYNLSPSCSPYAGKVQVYDIYAPICPIRDIPKRCDLYQFSFSEHPVLTQMQIQELHEKVNLYSTHITISKPKIESIIRGMWSGVLWVASADEGNNFVRDSFRRLFRFDNSILFKSLFKIKLQEGRKEELSHISVEWSPHLRFDKERYWKEDRPLRNMKYWVAIEGFGASMLRKMAWMTHQISGAPLADCFFTVQEYWNLYHKSLVNVSLLKNAVENKGIFHVGTYRLPTHVPFVNVFIHMCTQLLNDDTKWSNGKLRRRFSIKDQNGMMMRIDTASKRDAVQSMISWLKSPSRVRKHQKKSPRSLHGRWSPVQTKKRSYFWFEGDAPNLESIEKRTPVFRWKGVFLYRENKSENTV